LYTVDDSTPSQLAADMDNMFICGKGPCHITASQKYTNNKDKLGYDKS